MVNSVCGIRSTGRICVDIADALAMRGDAVKIVYGRENVPKQYQHYAWRIGTDFDLKVHGLKARLVDGVGLGSKIATKKLINEIMVYDPDIIHIHNLHGYYINYEILFDYLKTRKKSVIWTLHDCWSFTGHCPYFEFVNCEKWLTGCGKCQQIGEYPKSYFDFSRRNWKQKKKAFDGVENMILVTPSQWLADLVKQSYMKNYPVKVIHNGVDTKVFRPIISDVREKYRLSGKKVILGVASQWNYRKGLNYMIELAKRLGNQYIVVVIGVTEEQNKGLPSNMLGLLKTSSTQELAEWYSVAEVFVNPTLEDNYPTTNLEAIACGTPVVTFDSGGSAESARLYGQAVKKGDVTAMCEIIRKNKFVRLPMDLSSENMVFQYLSLYDNVTKENM